MGATRLFAIGLFMFVGSCGGAATEVAYPDESCKAAGCGRVTTIGVIGDQHRLADGTISTDSFFFVDLEAKDEKGSPYAYAVSCSACPFEVGKRYRARLNPEGTQLHSIL